MLTQKIVEIERVRKTLSAPQPAHLHQLCTLPDVPVMPETILLMELQAGADCPALGEISQIVLADLGATLQILRLAGREFTDAAERPARIEDCISLLGLEACLEAISRQTVAKSVHRAQISEFWNHAARIAALCALLSDESPVAADPSDAYLVGLFHELGTLPSLLGWPSSVQLAATQDHSGLRLAQAWSLPAGVTDYFSECVRPVHASPWTGLVRKAHFIEGLQSSVASTDPTLEIPYYTEPQILAPAPSRAASA